MTLADRLSRNQLDLINGLYLFKGEPFSGQCYNGNSYKWVLFGCDKGKLHGEYKVYKSGYGCEEDFLIIPQQYFGEHAEFFPDGNIFRGGLWYMESYENGIKEGVSKRYSPDGKVIRISNYKQGMLLTE